MSDRVLVVDDEPNFLASVRRGLRGRYDLTTVESGAEALRAISESGPFSVVVCDQQMPHMNGVEALHRIRDLTPDTVRIMLTGNADQETAIAAINQGQVFRFLSKPCPSADLATAIDSALAAYHAAAAERAVIAAQMRRLSDYDFLTDLPNRVMMVARVSQAILTSSRTGRRLALFMVDLDHFKAVNEAFGYDCGDELLKQVADRLLTGVRATDVVSRLGGAFFVLLDDIDDNDSVIMLADVLRRRLRQPYHLAGQTITITASIGVSLFPEDGSSLDDLIKYAEIALRVAKQGGGDAVSLFEPTMNESRRSRLWLETGLRAALHANEFFMVFQPQFEISSRRLIGCEALVRWNHDGTMIPPAQFIPIAEETGLILPLGDWIIAEAIRAAAIFQQYCPLLVAINLSPIQLRQPGLAGHIFGLAAEAGMPLAQLEFEVTEGVLMDGTGGLATLARLRQAGAALSIDDFGTGYSNLSYLKRFRVDKIKIDRSFVEDITTNNESRAITAAITGMAHTLGLKTIAEGVETEEQLEVLSEVGCQQIQGFLLGRPVTLTDFLAAFAPA